MNQASARLQTYCWHGFRGPGAAAACVTHVLFLLVAWPRILWARWRPTGSVVHQRGVARLEASFRPRHPAKTGTSMYVLYIVGTGRAVGQPILEDAFLRNGKGVEDTEDFVVCILRWVEKYFVAKISKDVSTEICRFCTAVFLKALLSRSMSTRTLISGMEGKRLPLS